MIKNRDFWMALDIIKMDVLKAKEWANSHVGKPVR